MKDALVNGESVLDSGLAIPAADGQRSVEILISSASARAEGTVTDKNDLPAAGAIVALVPEEGRRKLFRLCRDSATDQYGNSRSVESRLENTSYLLGRMWNMMHGKIRIF